MEHSPSCPSDRNDKRRSRLTVSRGTSIQWKLAHVCRDFLVSYTQWVTDLWGRASARVGVRGLRDRARHVRPSTSRRVRESGGRPEAACSRGSPRVRGTSRRARLGPPSKDRWPPRRCSATVQDSRRPVAFRRHTWKVIDARPPSRRVSVTAMQKQAGMGGIGRGPSPLGGGRRGGGGSGPSLRSPAGGDAPGKGTRAPRAAGPGAPLLRPQVSALPTHGPSRPAPPPRPAWPQGGGPRVHYHRWPTRAASPEVGRGAGEAPRVLRERFLDTSLLSLAGE